MENEEEVLEALDEFAKRHSGKISHVLEQYLCRIAATGVTIFPWNKLKPLLIHKLDTVVQEFQERCPMSQQSTSPNVEHVSFDVMKNRLIDDINLFNGIPFTIQRLCELVTNPTKHYQKTDKYMRGVEKNLVVVTTVDPYGNRIVNENKAEANGVEVSSSRDLLCQSDALVSPFLPPVPLNSPATSTSGSWYSSLTSVVDSPSSYPNWRNQDAVATDEAAESNRMCDDSDSLEPPRKMLRLEESEDCETEGTTEPSVGTETGSEEQKAIAPLLTQLLSTSSTAEQAVPSEDQQQKSAQTEDSVETDESEAKDERAEPAGGGRTGLFPGETAGETNSAVDMTESSEATTATSDGFETTVDDRGVLSGGSDAQPSYVENRFSDSYVTTSDEGTVAMASETEQETSETNADSSDRKGGQRSRESPEEKSVEVDTAEALSTSEWSSTSDSSVNLDSVSNCGDGDCGVDSLLETSSTSVAFADVKSCDFGGDGHRTVNRESEATSEARSVSNEERRPSDSEPALGCFSGEESKLEQVGSSVWDSSSVSPMDTD